MPRWLSGRETDPYTWIHTRDMAAGKLSQDPFLSLQPTFGARVPLAASLRCAELGR